MGRDIKEIPYLHGSGTRRFDAPRPETLRAASDLPGFELSIGWNVTMDAMLQKIPYEELMSVFEYHFQKPDAGLLPPETKLRDFAVFAQVPPRLQEPPVPIEFYLTQEVDPILNAAKVYGLLRAPSDSVQVLLREAHRIQRWFQGQNLPMMYRVDPVYGIVQGSDVEAVQPDACHPSPSVVLTLILTDDPGHPELALMDYVPGPYRKTYARIFEKYNKTKPGKLTLLGVDLGRIFKRKGESAGPLRHPWKYDLIRAFLRHLLQRHYWMRIRVSLVYTEVHEDDFLNSPFQSSNILFFPTRPCRLFNEIDELFQEVPT